MKKFIAIILSLIAVLSMAVPAYAATNTIPTKTLNSILESYRTALKSGEKYLDLSGYSLGNDSTTYIELYNYLLNSTSELGTIDIGRYSETYATFVLDDTAGRINGVKIIYSDRYQNADGTCNTELVKEETKIIQSRYQKALKLANRNMSDVEKALVFYDFMQIAADYPEPTEVTSYGVEIYPDHTRTFAGFLVDGYAVCAAYSKIYAMLLNDSGVKAVTVYSEKMNHEWVMAEIDGDWYHFDPTWDDIWYDEGLTAYSNANADIWDIGAVGHKYFLKSDDEIKELRHSDWTVSYSVNPDYLSAAPKSGPSGKYKGKFFDQENCGYLTFSAMNYINGNWYFTDKNTNSVVRITHDGETELIPFPYDDDFVNYASAYGDNLYVASSYGVFRLDTISDRYEKIFEIPEDKRETDKFTEMKIAFDEMTLIKVCYIYEGDDHDTYEDFTTETEKYDMTSVSGMQAIFDEKTEIEISAARDFEPLSNAEITKPNITAEKRTIRTEATETFSEKREAENTRVMSLIYLGVAAVLILFAIVAVIIAIIRSRK